MNARHLVSQLAKHPVQKETRVAKILNKTVVFLKQRVTPLLIIRQRTIY